MNDTQEKDIVLVLSGRKYFLHRLPTLDAANLDARVLSLLFPVIGALDISNLSEKSDIDFAAVGAMMSKALSGLSKKDLESIILDSVIRTGVETGEGGVDEINSIQKVNQYVRNLMDLYKLIFECWRVDELTPFAVWSRFGTKIKAINISKKVENGVKKSGIALAGLGGSDPT